jgi:uncharacterized protein YkwD
MAIGAHNAGFWRLIAAIFAVATLLVAAGPGAERAEAGTACTKFGEVRAEKLRNRQARAAIRCYLNRQRAKRGFKKLDNDRRLQRASQKHNEVMLKKGCFSHECPGEASLEARLRGVEYLIGGLLGWTYGENIAYGGEYLGTPKAIVKAWMHSPGHKANILNSQFKDVGVGFSPGIPGNPNADGGTYTTDFGMRRLR